MRRSPGPVRSRTTSPTGMYGPHQREVRVTVATALILLLVLAIAALLGGNL